MALAFNVRVGDSIEMEHTGHGYLGSFRVDHKSGNAVRLVFDMPAAILVRVMNHRAHGITWGLSGDPHAPLKVAAG